MSAPLGAVRAVRLIARREITTRVRSTSFLISNAVLLVIIVGGVVAASVFGGGAQDPKRVGLVGAAQSLSSSLTVGGDAVDLPISIRELSEVQAARNQVAAGDLEVALVAGTGGGFVAITDKDVPSDLRRVLDIAVQQQALAAALREQGVDPAQLSAATAGAVVTVDALDPAGPDQGQRLALAYIAVSLLYVQLLFTGLAVATGVVEEKTSRVVELLLSTVKPLHLLVGKILGIGVVGVVQLVAYGVAGLGTALTTGLLTITGTAVAVFAGTLGWFVLGFAFFAVLYAAAGSLVSRQEEVSSVTAPLTVLVVIMFVLAQTSVQDPGGTVSSVMSWIPPFSAILMPLRIAAGVTGPVQVAGTAALMLVVTAGLAVVSAAIYQRSVLRSGSKLSWRQALGRD